MNHLQAARQLLTAIAAEATDLAEVLQQVADAGAAGRVPVETEPLAALPAALTALLTSLREVADQVGNRVDPRQL